VEHRIADRRMGEQDIHSSRRHNNEHTDSEVGITATTVVEDEAGGPGEVVVTIPKAVLGELNESSKFIAW